MNRRTIFVLMLLLAGMALLTPLLTTGWLERRTPATRAAIAFLERLAVGDISAAKDLATGEVFGRLTSRHEIPPAVWVVDSRVGTRVTGNGWAELSMVVETEDGAGSINVQWYRLGLTQDNGHWKVYRMETVTPDLGSGLRQGVSRDDLQAARQVFQDYMEQLAANRYAEAGQLLVGPARTAHEAGAPVMSGTPVVREVSEITGRALWRRGKLLTVQAGYLVDGRQVQVVALFYHTRKGWRIAEVSQT